VETIFQICLSNSLVALVLAAGLAARGGRPAFVHALWVLVLIKLVTPPLLRVPLAPDSARALLTEVQMLVAPAPPVHSAPTRYPGMLDDYYTWRYWGGSGIGLQAGSRSTPNPAAIAGAKAPRRAVVGRVSVPSPQASAMPLRAAIAARPDDLLRRIATRTPSSSHALVLAVWLGIAALWWGLAAARLRKFRRLLQSASRASAELQDQTRRLADRLSLRRAPEVWLVPAAIPPMLWAMGTRPMLLVPAALLGRLGADRRAAILVHELAHMKRRDHWIRLLEIVVSGLYWWNPLVWWSRRALREAEEQCCDGWVVWALPECARSYATTILDTVDYLAEAPDLDPLVGTALTSAHQLMRRLLQIVGGTTSKHLCWPGTMALVGLVLLVLALGPACSPRRFFKAVDLGTLGGRQTRPIRLNDRGQVIGYSSVSEEFREGRAPVASHVFRTAPCRPIDRANDDLNALVGAGDDLPGRIVSAVGINRSGQVLVHMKLPPDPNVLFNPVNTNRTFRIDGRRVIELNPDSKPKPFQIYNDSGRVPGMRVAHRLLPERSRPSGTIKDMRFMDVLGFRTLPDQPLDLARDDIGHCDWIGSISPST